MKKAALKAKNCPLRPKYHFLPPANWINDPNGPIYYKGYYHLFYQHNPFGKGWNKIHWGHTKSKDLVHWERLPIALSPSKELGEKHCFSGCSVIHEGIPTILYTSINSPESIYLGAEQWIAFGSDDMISWKKYKNNPAMTGEIHGELKIYEWRDPFLWKEGDIWFLVLCGLKRKPKQPIVLLYQSKDLKQWNFIGELCIGDKKYRNIWECPNFFELNDKHVLIVSSQERDSAELLGSRKTLYSIGKYESQKFSPKKWGIVDHGRRFYAPTTMRAPDNRVLMWGWIYAQGTQGWNGCLSLPRTLSLRTDNVLEFQPVSELKTLRTNHWNYDSIELNSGESSQIQYLSDMQFEIKLDLNVENVHIFNIALVHPESSIATKLIYFNKTANCLSCYDNKVDLSSCNSPNNIKFHIFLDVSVFEIFFNKEIVISGQIDQDIKENKLIRIQAVDGSLSIDKIDIWKLKSIW